MHTPPSRPSVSSRPRLIRLFTVMGVLLGIVGWQTLHRKQALADNPLHGDHEETPAALHAVLMRTPVDQRQPLLLQYVGDASDGLRYAAVDALGAYHDTAASNAIEKAFRDSASVVRIRAMETMITVAPERGLRLLLSGLRDTDSWVRDAAITQIVQHIDHAPKMVDRRAVPMLIRALDDTDAFVTFTAIGALRKITGNPWRYRHADSPERQQAVTQRWKQWWEQNRAHYAIPAVYADPPMIQPERSEEAPSFSLPDIADRNVSLGGQKGRVTLLNFWGTRCGPCQAEVPDLERLHEVYGSQAFDLVGVAVGETEGKEGVQRYCQQHGVQYRQALATNAILDDYGHIEEVPVTVLLDKRGRIRYRWEGLRDFETFSAAVQRLLKE